MKNEWKPSIFLYPLFKGKEREDQKVYVRVPLSDGFRFDFLNFFFFIFKDRNGDQIWFTVACYGKGYCQVLMSASQGKNRFTTQIATETVPAEVNFFSEDEELFLMIVKDPCVLYR